MDSEELTVRTGDRLVTDMTSEVERFCDGRGDGLVNVFVPHAKAGIAPMELGSGSEADLETVLEDVLPTDDRWRHRHGSTGHGRDHLLPAFVSPSVSIPVVAGRPALGTWQSIALIDPNGDNPDRCVRLTFLAG